METRRKELRKEKRLPRNVKRAEYREDRDSGDNRWKKKEAVRRISDSSSEKIEEERAKEKSEMCLREIKERYQGIRVE